MASSPIAELFDAVDKLDADAVVAQFAPDARMLAADGRRAEGIDAVRDLLTDFLAGLRTTSHRITAEWHEDDVWIAELEATYELTDWMLTSPLPRAAVLRMGPEGIAEFHIYGAHERPLADHRTGEQGAWVRGHWIPPV